MRFANAREPARFAAGRHGEQGDVEHAVGKAGTLCGLPRGEITVFRHLFPVGADHACGRCSSLARGAPSEPSAQERLYEEISRAPVGALRDELMAWLLRGAEISLWINGPTDALVEHYAQLDEVTEGADAVAGTVERHDRIGLARVEAAPHHRFLVLLPPAEPPAIARLRSSG